jgi:drug/metabolite transporter (DMT)-like permease
MGILFALLSAIITGLGDFFLKKPTKGFSPFTSFVVMSLVGLIVWPFSIFFIRFDPNQLLTGLLFGALSGLLGQGYYIYALSKGTLSITGTLLSTFPIFTIIFSVLINHEVITPQGLIAIVLMIIGTIIVALPGKTTKEVIKPLLIFLPLSAALAIGFSDTLAKKYINDAGAGTFLVATGIMQFFVSLICFKLAKGKIRDLVAIAKSPINYKHIILGSSLLSISTLCVFLAFEYTTASLAAPIIGSAPIFILIFANIFLKEKLSRKNAIGIVMVVIGILAASF